MAEGFLLSRVLLRFDRQSRDLIEQLSAVVLTPDGSLWVGSDELQGVERLSSISPYIYGNHQPFAIADFVELFDQSGEIDIEGMAYDSQYLWFTGSHSTKRNKAKGKKPEKDIRRLSEVETELNRYLLARIPVIGSELFKSCSHPDDPNQTLTAACLQKSEQGNLLSDALKADDHLGPFLSAALPSKENGVDIEGLAVQGNRVFLGLRGPVLRGWAIILEVEMVQTDLDILTLKDLGSGQLYKKHFVDLDGLGIRELCFDGSDLIILAGPTMTLAGAMRIFRFKDALELPANSLFGQDTNRLEVLFDLPFNRTGDRAEGLSLFSCLGQTNSLLVVYDSPAEARTQEENAVFADVFRLT